MMIVACAEVRPRQQQQQQQQWWRKNGENGEVELTLGHMQCSEPAGEE